MAVLADTEKFIERFLKVVYFIAAISIVCYVFQMLMPGVLKAILPQYDSNFSYSIWSDSVNYRTYSYDAWGKFLFTFDEAHGKKNVGIFSEPGCYQIALNSALFCLLFLNSFIDSEMTEKRGRYFIILSIAILTSQSTTGYIGYLAIIFVYLFGKKEEENKIKRRILLALIILLGVLTVEFSVNGTDSMLSRAFLSKLFSDSNEVSLMESTGVYRTYAIYTSLTSMIQHPLGVGYAQINNLIAVLWDSSAAGAVLLVTGAALGIPTLVMIIVWTIYPVFISNSLKIGSKLLFVFLFFNTELAQSEEIYVTIIIIPLYLYVIKTRSINSLQIKSQAEINEL